MSGGLRRFDHFAEIQNSEGKLQSYPGFPLVRCIPLSQLL